MSRNHAVGATSVSLAGWNRRAPRTPHECETGPSEGTVEILRRTSTSLVRQDPESPLHYAFGGREAGLEVKMAPMVAILQTISDFRRQVMVWRRGKVGRVGARG